jgi:hypothetical protein
MYTFLLNNPEATNAITVTIDEANIRAVNYKALQLSYIVKYIQLVNTYMLRCVAG